MLQHTRCHSQRHKIWRFMKKILLIFIGLLLALNNVYASQTDPQYFIATLNVERSVSFLGGTINSTINTDTGALNTALNPAFLLTVNDTKSHNLTITATANTQSGSVNAIFNNSSVPYIILTNSSYLPTTSAIDDIKTLGPTAANNPNAIAYAITGPAPVSGKLTVSFNTTSNLWNLELKNKGQTKITVTVPAGSPFTNTYSIDDSAGGYTATITVTFTS